MAATRFTTAPGETVKQVMTEQNYEGKAFMVGQ